MAPAIPKPKGVETAFRVLHRRLATALARLNKEAAAKMKAGDYEAAQGWMDLGRTISDFRSRTSAFAEEWRTLVRGARLAGAAGDDGHESARGSRRAEITPVWEFYKPVLTVIDQSGGELDLGGILRRLTPTISRRLTIRDTPLAKKNGVPRWHDTVRRVRRHAQREGWLESRTGDVWRITEKGRRFVASDGGSPH
jgi:Mrr restriction endonuclease-like protein